MESSFVHARCARRKLEKRIALAEGAESEAAAAAAPKNRAKPRAKPSPAPVGKPAAPASNQPRVRVLRKVKRGEVVPPAGESLPAAGSGAPVVVAESPSVLEASVLSSVSQVMEARAIRAAEAEVASNALAEAQLPGAAVEKSLLESPELDLFKTARPAPPRNPAPQAQLCPQCHRELATVICHKSTVQACLGCMGIWIANPVLHDLAGKPEWHQQVIAAMQMAAARASGV